MNTPAKMFFSTLFMGAIVVVASFAITHVILYFYQHFPSLQNKAIAFHHLFIGFILWNGSLMIMTWTTVAHTSNHQRKVLSVTFVLLVLTGAAMISMNAGLNSVLSQSFIFLAMCIVKFRRFEQYVTDAHYRRET